MMTLLRRITGIVLLGSLMASFSPAYAQSSFSDVFPLHANAEAIRALKDQKILEGYADGSFKPDVSVNRAEFLKIILASRDGGRAENAGDERCFKDVANEWFARYVCGAMKEGIIAGYPDGTFKPEQTINFAEAAKILALAYKQDVKEGYVEWYEPFARALEESKAIPPTINALDKKMTRGEMAEMMWRLKDNVTTKPSIGYLNVKYPETKTNFASDVVQNAKSCADIHALLSSSGVNDGRVYKSQNMMDGLAAPAPAGMARGNEESNEMTGLDSYSTTNVQVAGVDEGDIVKTDGSYVYYVNNTRIQIVKAVPPTSLSIEATIDYADDAFNPSNVYIDVNHLIVIGTKWNQGPVWKMREAMPTLWPGPSYSQKSEVRIYDITSKKSPKIVRKVTFDGSTISTRRIGDKLYVVLNQTPLSPGPMPLGSVDEKSVLPSMEDSAEGNSAKPVSRCIDVAILPHIPQPQYLTIAVVPVRDTSKKVATSVVLGNAENVYASLDNLYVATTEWNYVWDSKYPQNTEKTNIYKFAYTDNGVAFEQQGNVPGRILNQFSMDEQNAYFRIATTSNRAQASTSNNLYVLDNEMSVVGSITDIAPGESIYSVRFMGNRAYMVTFKRVDPLFVIDTSDPKNPRILGKLKIPGWSDYLHPYDETHLIGFGKEVDETIDADKVHDNEAVYYTAVLGMKVSLFDVSDVENPREMHKVVIGDRGTDSPLLRDHKALLFERNNDLLAFPVSVMELPEDVSPKDTDTYPQQSFQGAYVFSVSLDKGFDLRGRISHYTEDEMLKSGSSLYGKDIDRIIRIGDSLYTTSPGGVMSNELGSLKEQDSVPFTRNTVEDIVY